MPAIAYKIYDELNRPVDLETSYLQAQKHSPFLLLGQTEILKPDGRVLVKVYDGIALRKNFRVSPPSFALDQLTQERITKINFFMLKTFDFLPNGRLINKKYLTLKDALVSPIDLPGDLIYKNDQSTIHFFNSLDYQAAEQDAIALSHVKASQYMTSLIFSEDEYSKQALWLTSCADEFVSPKLELEEHAKETIEQWEIIFNSAIKSLNKIQKKYFT